MWIIDRISKKQKARNDACDALIIQLQQAKQELEQLFVEKNRYISNETLSSWKCRHNDAVAALSPQKQEQHHRARNYCNLLHAATQLSSALASLQERVCTHNQEIMKRRMQVVRSLIGTVEGKQLDDQQVLCISKEAHNHLVLAGAGTGKTTTVVGLIKYLLRSKQYAPEDILVLSFTNASATEMRERIQAETGAPVEASTFHKLGLNILSAVEGVKPRITQISLPKLITSTIKTQMCDSAYLKKLNAYCMHHRVLARSEFDFRDEKEYKAYLRQNPPTTLRNETVKSYGEMEIANYLFLHGITYRYEQPYELDTRTAQYGQYKPDFYLPDYHIYIEYFGIDQHGNPPAYFNNDYVASMKWKRELHQKNHTTMIECYAYKNFDGELLSLLEQKLTANDVVLQPEDEQALWKQLSTENENQLSGLTQLMETVINLMKSNRYDIPTVRALSRKLARAYDTNLLLDLITPLWNAYHVQLEAAGEIDFNDMINQATDAVRQGRYFNPYSIVIVDEYQDISRSRFQLLLSLRQARNYRLFCVGDDWQSIYRFAGSDIGFILRFTAYWGPTEISRIETTYRFSQRLIDVTSGFIMQNPAQERKNIRGVPSDAAPVLGVVSGTKDWYAVSAMVERLVELPANSSVFLIGRYSFDVKQLEHCVAFQLGFDTKNNRVTVAFPQRPDLKIAFMTAHKSKGLQADYVFILNNKNGKMGFPSQIQDAPILSLLLEQGESCPFAEERRLFYVAMTRAKKQVFFLTVKGQESGFIQELHRNFGSEMKEKVRYCPQCGGVLRRKTGPYGAFWGCENYKTQGCRYVKKIQNQKT